MSDLYLPSDDSEPEETPRLSDAVPPGEFEIEGAAPDHEFELPGRDGGHDAGPQSPELSPPPPPSLKPPPPGLKASEPSPASRPDDADLTRRIERVTREGGFQERVTTDYDDPDTGGQDWRSVKSGDPFTRLYLDRTQAGRITDAMVRTHGLLIEKFWERKRKQIEAGTPARDRNLRVFGDRAEILGFETQARHDAQALATAELRAKILDDLLVSVRNRLLARFEDFVVGDQALSRPESERLLAQAGSEGWPSPAAAAYVLSELDRRGYRSVNGDAPLPEHGPAADWLLSATWTGSSQAHTTPETVIGQTLATLMISGALAGEQVAALIDEASDAGIDPEEAAGFIAERLGVFRDEWVPAPGEESEEGALSVALGSVRWLSPERYRGESEEDERRARRDLEAAVARAVANGKVSQADARTLLDSTPLDRDEAARVVQSEIDARGLQPASTPTGATDSERLISVDWKAHSPGLPPPRPRWGMRLLVGFGALVAALAVLTIVGSLMEGESEGPPRATIDTQRLNIRTEPTATGGDDTVAGKATQGETFEVTGYTRNAEGRRWLRIDYFGQQAWVSDRYVQFARYDDVPEVDASDGFADGAIPSSAADPQVDQGGAEYEESGYDGQAASPNVSAAPSPSSVPTLRPSVREQAPQPVRPAAPSRPADRVYASRELDQPATPSASPRAESPPGGYAGPVRVAVEVSASGRVTSTRCQTSAPQVVCAEAERRARDVRFQPAQLRGYPVRTQSEVTVVFTAAVQPPAAAAGQSCTSSIIRALMTEVNQTDARCRRLQDPAEKQDCEARLARANADLNTCTQ